MTLLETLRDRPPTHPREIAPQTLETADRLSQVVLGSGSFAGPKVCTPPNSSPLGAAELNLKSNRKRKRVEWSPWTEYRRPSGFTTTGLVVDDAQIRPIPPSRERKSSKSILKPYDRLVPVTSLCASSPSQRPPGEHRRGLAGMLESIVQQLAGEPRSPRLDAYLTLNRTLKQYGEIPDSSLTEKLPLFTQFIQRDVSAKIGASGALDAALITQALKLLITFVWMPQLSCHMTDEFCETMLKHAIAALESPHPHKAIAIHYMHLLAMQNFPTSLMTSERIDRIISALDSIGKRVKGKAVICESLGIYQKLVVQGRHVMVQRGRHWIDHLFIHMLSSDKEVRTRALSLGAEAGLALGTTSQMSRVVKNTLNRTVNEETFARCIEQRLTKAVVMKEVGPDVPKIWAIVILFLRSRPRQLEQWEHLKAWLLIIQKCFNAADQAVKAQANIAWNRMIYAIHPDEVTGSVMIRTLRQPIIGQLEKSGFEETDSRNIVLASLCSLLYYSLCPSAGLKQLDTYWEEYVFQIVVGSVIQKTKKVCYGLEILAALFDGTSQRPWHDYRAMDGKQISPEELPRLDPKWVRSRTHVVLDACQRVFETVPWIDELTEMAQVKRLWRNLMQTIADAGSVEVKLSDELMVAIAHILNFLQSIWDKGPCALNASGENATAIFIDRFAFLVTTTLTSLGPLAFTEKLLARKTGEVMEAIGTPSRRSLHHPRATATSPLAYLFQLLAKPGPGYKIDPAHYLLAKAILQACCNARLSTRSQLEILGDCMQNLPSFTSQDVDAEPLNSSLWQAVAESTITTVCALRVHMSSESEFNTADHHNIVTVIVGILDRGCDLSGEKSLSLWQDLFHSTMTSLSSQVRGAGCSTALIEPVANMLHYGPDRTDIASLLCRATYIVDKVPCEIYEELSGNRKLSKDTRIPDLGRTENPNALLEMINDMLITSYQLFSITSSARITQFLLAVKKLVASCPLPSSLFILSRVQNGVGMWIQDAEQKLPAEEPSPEGACLTVLGLWTEINNAIRRSPHKNSFLLRSFEALIYAGLQSRIQTITISALALWHSTFAAEESLECPTRIKDTLDKLHSIAISHSLDSAHNADHEMAAVDSWPMASQDNQSELLHRHGEAGSSLLPQLDLAEQAQPAQQESTPSGSTAPFTLQLPDPERQELPASSNFSVAVVIERRRSRGDIDAQTAITADNADRGNNQLHWAMLPSRNTQDEMHEGIDSTPKSYISEAADEFACLMDVMDTSENEDDTVDLSPHSLSRKIRSDEERSLEGAIPNGKYSHPSHLLTPGRYVSKQKKRKTPPTAAKRSLKRGRQGPRRDDFGNEEILDCIVLQQPSARSSNASNRCVEQDDQSNSLLEDNRELSQVMDLTESDDSRWNLSTERDQTSSLLASGQSQASSSSRDEGAGVSKKQRLVKLGRASPANSGRSTTASVILSGDAKDTSMSDDTAGILDGSVMTSQLSWDPQPHAPEISDDHVTHIDTPELASSPHQRPREGQLALEQGILRDAEATEGVSYAARAVPSRTQATRPAPASSHGGYTHDDREAPLASALDGAAPGSSPRFRATSVQTEAAAGEASTSTAEEQGSSRSPAVASIIGGLKRILKELRRAVLGSHEVREIDDLLFDAKRETFAAEGRRRQGSEDSLTWTQ